MKIEWACSHNVSRTCERVKNNPLIYLHRKSGFHRFLSKVKAARNLCHKINSNIYIVSIECFFARLFTEFPTFSEFQSVKTMFFKFHLKIAHLKQVFFLNNRIYCNYNLNNNILMITFRFNSIKFTLFRYKTISNSHFCS